MTDYEALKYLKKARDKETRVKYKAALEHAIDVIKLKNPCASCRSYKLKRNERPCLFCVCNKEN